MSVGHYRHHRVTVHRPEAIVQLNHLNLTVDDPAATRDYLERYFGLIPAGTPSDESRFCLMRDDGGLVLSLMRGPNPDYPSSFHIGFVQPDRAGVDAINERLREDGYEPKPPRIFHGSWTFYTRAPGGFMVEVLAP